MLYFLKNKIFLNQHLILAPRDHLWCGHWEALCALLSLPLSEGIERAEPQTGPLVAGGGQPLLWPGDLGVLVSYGSSRFPKLTGFNQHRQSWLVWLSGLSTRM